MVDKTWIEIKASLYETISSLEKELQSEQTTTDLLNPFVSTDKIETEVRNHHIRSALTNCRQAQKAIGLRRGERISEEWLKYLDKEEEEVFVRFYEKKNRVSEIACDLGIKEADIQKHFNRSIKKIINYIREEGA